MRKYLRFGFVVTIFLFTKASSQSPINTDQSYLIIGDISKVKLTVQEIVLSVSDTNGFKRFVTSPVNGTFSFSGKVIEPKQAQIYLHVKGDTLFPLRYFRFFILEPATYRFIALNDTFSRSIVTGSAINAQHENYLDILKPKWRQLNLSRSAKQSAADSGNIVRTRQLYAMIDSLETELKNVYASYALSHADNWVGLLATADLLRPPAPDAEKANFIFSNLAPALQNSFYGKTIRKDIEKFSKTSVGKMAPPFSQPDTNGREVQLTSLLGKVVLLDFWASWCVPCRKEFPTLKNIYKKYNALGFEIMGISFDTDKNKWSGAINEDELKWLHISDLRSPNRVGELYNIGPIPQNILLDKEGKILAKNIDGTDLEKKLEEVLK